MLFLSNHEKGQWDRTAGEIVRRRIPPATSPEGIRKNLESAFHFYAASRLAEGGEGELARDWLRAGALMEEDGLFLSTFLLGFLERHEGELRKPAVAFRDPRPFLHYASIPIIVESRSRFLTQACHSLPSFPGPLRIMDIGCGDGTLTIRMIQQLLDAGKAGSLEEVLLVDASDAMVTLAERNVGEAFPDASVRTVHSRIQDFSGHIRDHFDIAMSSIAFHHMPVEDKATNISRLKPWIDHFVLFEMDGNHDTPGMGSPDLAVSVYQTYGRLIDIAYAHDAPVDVVNDCVDSFLMVELISILTEPRGTRSDYHMLREQWMELFSGTLGPEFSIGCNSTSYSDEYLTLFTMHYGKSG